MSKIKVTKNFSWSDRLSTIADGLFMVLLGSWGTMWLFEALNEVWDWIPALSFASSFSIFIALAIIINSLVRMAVLAEEGQSS